MENIEKLNCKKCNNEKPLVDFGEDKSKASGYNNECKSCCNERRRANYSIAKFAITTKQMFCATDREIIREAKRATRLEYERTEKMYAKGKACNSAESSIEERYDAICQVEQTKKPCYSILEKWVR
jgi:hypothetical protein